MSVWSCCGVGPQSGTTRQLYHQSLDGKSILARCPLLLRLPTERGHHITRADLVDLLSNGPNDLVARQRTASLSFGPRMLIDQQQSPLPGRLEFVGELQDPRDVVRDREMPAPHSC